jgi:hypothetical protein
MAAKGSPSARSARPKASAPGSSCRRATPRRCRRIWPRSAPWRRRTPWRSLGSTGRASRRRARRAWQRHAAPALARAEPGRDRLAVASRDDPLSNRVFTGYEDIVAPCCAARNQLVDRPWRIRSIGRRARAEGLRSRRAGVGRQDRGMGPPPPRIEARDALPEPTPDREPPDREPSLRRARRRDAPSPARTRPASRRRGRTAGRPPARRRSARPRSAPCSAPSPCPAAPPG